MLHNLIVIHIYKKVKILIISILEQQMEYLSYMNQVVFYKMFQ